MQRQQHLALGLRPEPGYIFTGPDGGPLWPQRVTARFRQVCDQLGLPRIGLHGLRHTSVTFAIASGQSPKLVAQRHGHSSESFTIGRYSHVMPGHDRAAAEAFLKALGEAARENASDLVTTVVATNGPGRGESWYLTGTLEVRPLGFEPRTCGLRVILKTCWLLS